MRRILLLSVSLVALLGFAGCSDDDAGGGLSGSASLSWRIGARTCSEVGVERIRISLSEGGSMTPAEVSCESRAAEVSGLRPGQYRFLVEGLDAAGVARYEAQTERVEIRANGSTVVPSAVLSAKLAELVLSWSFGGPLCSQAGVSHVDVHIFDDYGFEESYQRTGCDLGETSLNTRPGEWDVVVHGISGEGAVSYFSVFEVELQPGGKLEQSVTLESSATSN